MEPTLIKLGDQSFMGYRLGTLELTSGIGSETITAYFAVADDDEPARVIVDYNEPSPDVFIEDMRFLEEFGVFGTHRLVWAATWQGTIQPEHIPEIRAWFRRYEGWGT